MTESKETYRTDLINGAIGAKRLTNEEVAKAAGVAVKSVSAVRNGEPNVKLPTLKAVVEALGLTMEEIFREERAAA